MGSLDVILITISGAGLIHGILVSIYLLTNKKNQTLSKSLMAIILLLMAFRVGKSVLFNFTEDLEFSVIIIGLSVLLLLGPLFYFYIQSITQPNYQLKASYVNYFLPFILMLVISFLATEQWFIENGKFWAFVLLSFVYLHFAFYIYRSSKIITKASKKGTQVLTKSQNMVILWSKYVIVGVIIIWVAYVLNIFEDKIPYILGPIIYSITIYALTFIAFNLKVINYDGMVFKEDLNKNTLFKNIDDIITKDKLYLNSNLDLNQIAKFLSVSSHQVSYMINEKTDTNFNSYINKFRIEEAKNIISKDTEKQYTIESIAYDVGFNSISTLILPLKNLSQLPLRSIEIHFFKTDEFIISSLQFIILQLIHNVKRFFCGYKTNYMQRVLILFTILFSFSLTSKAQNPEFENLKNIDNWLESNIKNSNLSGATVLIADKSKLIYSITVGKSNLESQRELQLNDYFKIASLSKVITTVAVMKLYEDGYFDLDDPIEKHIPIFKNTKVVNRQDDSENFTLEDANTKITIRHLLNQTAGFAYDGPIISKLYKEKNLSFFNPSHESLSSFMNDLSSMPTIHQPGEKFTYGPSTDILGYLIETVTNQNLATYLNKNIFIPLQMTGTGFDVHRQDINRLVRSYSKKDNILKAINKELDLKENHKTKVSMGGSGLVSTSSDFMRFCQMLLNNGVYQNKRIISRKSIEMMTTNQIGDIDYPQGFYPILGKDNKFGFGLNVITKKGEINEFYSQGSYYWEGAYSTTFIIDPKEGFAALMMTQLGGRESLKVRKDFRKSVYKTLK